MEIRHKTVFQLGELDDLIRHLRCDPVPSHEIERRHRMAMESRRFLNEHESLSIDIEELIRVEQETND